MVDPKISQFASTQSLYAIIQAQKASLAQRVMMQVEIKEDFQSWADKGEFDGVMREFKTLEEEKLKHKIRAPDKKEELEEEDTPVIQSVGSAEDTAAEFESRNPELKMKTLLILRNRIAPNDTPEDILRKVLEVYSDYSLADEALEYIIQTTSGAIRSNAEEARAAFNNAYEREIKAGRNMANEARSFSEKGLGSPTGLRDLYRDVTGNPRVPNALFDELFSEYSYAKMKTAIDFLLHSLGADLNAKGPSISAAELTKLVADARTLQAILGVYRFFEERMSLIANQFANYALTLPPRLSFELLAKQFMKLLGERYISPDKIIQLARVLGISEEVAAQIIIFTQMRDAIRGVAPKLYKTNRHRQDILKSIIEALEELEEEYAEEEDE